MIIVVCLSLCFAGAERGSRRSQVNFDPHCDRVRAAKHAPSNSIRVLERHNGLAEIVARAWRRAPGHNGDRS